MAEREGGEREGGGVRPLALGVAAILCISTPAGAQAVTQRKAASADALRIVKLLEVQKQIEFLIPKLSPVFAQQMLETVSQSERFKAQLTTPESRTRLAKVFQQEFERAFTSHVGDIVDEVAQGYDRRLSADDLREVVAFISSGAGARWAAVLSDIQQSSSGAGARVGALAGEEAYDAVLRRLDARTGLLK